MSLPTLRAVEPELPTGPGRTEAVLELVTELRERAEQHEQRAIEAEAANQDCREMIQAMLKRCPPGNEYAARCLGLLLLALETP